jgi:hypothetical protein
VNERGQQDLWYASIVVSVALLALGVAILVGPTVGGLPGRVHDALRALLTGSDRAVVDRTIPRAIRRESASLLPPEAGTPVPASTLAAATPPTATASIPCTAFRFQGALSIDEGQITFGRFNTVSDSYPAAPDDPLTQWKLVQIEPLDLDLDGDLDGALKEEMRIPVEQIVRLQIVDPFTQEALFAAQIQVPAIEIRGRNASINAELASNVDQIRIDNAIRSPTLSAFAGAEGGVLTMSWTHTHDIARALRSDEPLAAPMSGAIFAADCYR